MCPNVLNLPDVKLNSILRMRWLEEEVTRITGKNDQVMKENLLLRHVLEEQSAKINELVRRDEERRKKKTETSETIKTEPVEDVKPKKKGFWRPGVEDDKEETATVVSATTSGVGTVASTTPESLVQMRLNLPTAQTSTPTLPYAAMLEQVNINLIFCNSFFSDLIRWTETKFIFSTHAQLSHSTTWPVSQQLTATVPLHHQHLFLMVIIRAKVKFRQTFQNPQEQSSNYYIQPLSIANQPDPKIGWHQKKMCIKCKIDHS